MTVQEPNAVVVLTTVGESTDATAFARVLVADRRGLLAELATTIGDADANIDTVSMERPDGGDVAMFFGVQVRDRRHLAHTMRALRRVTDVRRVQRART